MAMFAFAGNPVDRIIFEACGLTQKEAEDILRALEECMNQTLSDAIIEKGDSELGPTTRVLAPVSPYELAQAAAEIINKLTPEKSFFIGMCVDYELRNEMRHTQYISNMLNT